MNKCRSVILVAVALLLISCNHSRKFTQNYYKENQSTIQSIRNRFNAIYDQQPFSLELKDKYLQRIGLEIITDSIKYIYAFNVNESNLVDTLRKYRFDIESMGKLIVDMQRAHCTWITNLDYYENREKKELLFLSVRHKALEVFLKPEKYFTLALFNQPQPVDEKKRLLDKESVNQLRKINGKVYRSINPEIFYAVTDSYR
ncbi:MAG: hypothetical protein ABWZ25_05230 [Chitinophagaceae bacterium]